MATKRNSFSVTFTQTPPPLAFYKRLATPFGQTLVFWDNQDALRCLYFLSEGRTEKTALLSLQKKWPRCTFRRATSNEPSWLAHLFKPGAALPLCLTGTPFQQKVWRALLDIKAGKTESYGALAARIGKPTAARAIGGAVGKNPIPYFVPCHRVLAGDGSLGGYTGGLALKRAMLKTEKASWIEG